MSELPSPDKFGTFTDLEVRDILLAYRKGGLVDRDTIDYEAGRVAAAEAEDYAEADIGVVRSIVTAALRYR